MVGFGPSWWLFLNRVPSYSSFISLIIFWWGSTKMLLLRNCDELIDFCVTSWNWSRVIDRPDLKDPFWNNDLKCFIWKLEHLNVAKPWKPKFLYRTLPHLQYRKKTNYAWIVWGWVWSWVCMVNQKHEWHGIIYIYWICENFEDMIFTSS